MRLIRLLSVLSVVLLIASCTLKTTWEIVGKWESVDHSEMIEFFETGAVLMETADMSLMTSYELSDPEHVRIDLGRLGNVRMKVSISNNELTLTRENGEVMKYRRVR